ncbi:MAG: 3-deoxy-D-manno-octulosonic acid transferase [Candidatus Omnitrophota bacterium]
MFIIYDLIFLFASLIYLPVYLFKKKLRPGFFRRIGRLPVLLDLDRPIWVHAVSVGEAMAVRGLIEGLRSLCPEKRIVISTVTATGNKIAKSIAKTDDFVTYLPLDLSFIVKKVIDRINPAIFIVAETEIWPNLISYLEKKDIPMITVNGRISDHSFKGYSMVKPLLWPILAKVNLFCVQTERDAERLKRLGVKNNRLKVTGNMKFDSQLLKEEGFSAVRYRRNLNLGPDDRLLVFGSTHPGEEEYALGCYKSLLTDFPNLKLLIAPRHPQRSGDLAKIISRSGFRSVLLSGSKGECPSCIARAVFILDTVGELIYYYSIADIVFVGGSLTKTGGHNILEPAALGKPVLFGPEMSNFRDIADLFLNNHAALLVHNQQELRAEIAVLLKFPEKALDLSKRAKEIILKNQGAVKRNLECIEKFIQ